MLYRSHGSPKTGPLTVVAFGSTPPRVFRRLQNLALLSVCLCLALLVIGVIGLDDLSRRLETPGVSSVSSDIERMLRLPFTLYLVFGSVLLPISLLGHAAAFLEKTRWLRIYEFASCA